MLRSPVLEGMEIKNPFLGMYLMCSRHSSEVSKEEAEGTSWGSGRERVGGGRNPDHHIVVHIPNEKLVKGLK